jgi:hypothetical protein
MYGVHHKEIILNSVTGQTSSYKVKTDMKNYMGRRKEPEGMGNKFS